MNRRTFLKFLTLGAVFAPFIRKTPPAPKENPYIPKDYNPSSTIHSNPCAMDYRWTSPRNLKAVRAEQEELRAINEAFYKGDMWT